MNFFLILLILSLINISMPNENNSKNPDLVTTLMINDESFVLEAYPSEFNQKIFAEKNIKLNKKLKWFSMGHPILIASESKSKLNKTKSIFHFTSEGFYASIQTLTKEQKYLLVEEAKQKYNFDAQIHQIVDLKLKDFVCELYLFGYDNDREKIIETILHGKVKTFKSSNLLLQFDYKNDSQEIKLFKEYLLEINNNDLRLDCEITPEGFGKFNFILKPNKRVIAICIFYLQILSFSI